ncbi:MAG: Crp/Fnr family transcriptional regulator [Anaerolineae bacterium]|nr:Crp/Fnr family transcriptional regulator [Anaerolineae bacterium]
MAFDPASVIEHIRSIDLFEGIDQDLLISIINDSVQESFPADHIIFFQGDPADKFYFLAKGRIKLSQVTLDGDQVVLRYLKPGDAFGIIAVLREIAFPVAAQVVEDCQVLVWDQESISRWIRQEPQIGINSIRLLADYILEFQKRIQELSTEKAERRIARALLRLAKQTGSKTPLGVLLGIKFTRQDIAEMTGTSMYTVSRMMSRWEEDELISSQNGLILISAPHQLAQLAEDFPADD